MSKQIEALKLALEALERYQVKRQDFDRFADEITAIREALAQSRSDEEQPAKQTIHCKHRRENKGVCPHHNLQCGWPKCNEPEQPAQQQEPWPEEPEGHIAGGVQPSKQTRVRWTERWYGSLAEKGWWICCGREHIAHLGTEVSSDEVRKIVDAHNRTSPPAQQQEPVAYKITGKLGDICSFRGSANVKKGDVVYTSPPARKPWVGLTDEEIHKMTVLMGINPEWKAEMEIVRSVVRNLEAKLREKNA